ncbi:MAG: hypothetical protein H7Y17_15340 [Chlorobia bacterium]|nr:hypothetical protein [Fimbriimonadaceae bacterium]
MSSIPPPVQDRGSQCPNCGSFRPAGQVYCANCGYGRPTHAQASSNTAQIVWIVLFILIGLPAGCLGGCFLVLGGGFGGTDVSFWLLTMGSLVVFLGLLVMLILSFRKRK